MCLFCATRTKETNNSVLCPGSFPLVGSSGFPHTPCVITITIENEGRLWPHYYYGPTTIRVTLASPNRRLKQSRNCRFYEVTVTEGPKYRGPKRRDLIFGCKFNPHRNTHRFLKALFARIARADKPDPAREEE